MLVVLQNFIADFSLTQLQRANSLFDSGGDFGQRGVGVRSSATPNGRKDLQSAGRDQMVTNLAELAEQARMQMKQLAVLALGPTRLYGAFGHARVLSPAMAGEIANRSL